MKLLLFLSIFAFSSAYETDGDVLVLTDKDINDAIKEHEFLLVEFYAPWCGHCKSLAPEYEKAAGILAKQDPPLRIAKVDATVETESAAEHGVRGYPTLKWFVNGEAQEYTGGRTADTIVSWINKKTGPPCKPLEDKEAVEAFKESADVVAVAFVSVEGDEFKAVEEAARGIEDVSFGVVSDADVASAFDAQSPSLVVFKNFDEGTATFSGDFEADSIKEFVQGNSVPLVSVFSQESAGKIFGSGVDNHFLYFNEEKHSSHESVMEALRTVATDFKGKTLFVFVPHSEDRVMEYFGLKKDDLPAAVHVALGEGDMKKFAFSGELNADEIKAAVEAYHAGDLAPTLKSEEIPEDNDGPVTVVVGKNFEDVVMDSSKDVLVEFYAPWCGHCKALTPIYEELGEKFAKKSSIVIAKVDATQNDIDHPAVKVQGFPTLYFFPANAKDAPLQYEGARELDDFVSYINEHATTLGDDAEGAEEAPKKDEL